MRVPVVYRSQRYSTVVHSQQSRGALHPARDDDDAVLILGMSQTVHGGLIMSLTDTLGSLAVASKGQYMTGVSTDVSTSFVRPAGKVGDVLNATATITALGTKHCERRAVMIQNPCYQGKTWLIPVSTLLTKVEPWSRMEASICAYRNMHIPLTAVPHSPYEVRG